MFDDILKTVRRKFLWAFNTGCALWDSESKLCVQLALPNLPTRTNSAIMRRGELFGACRTVIAGAPAVAVTIPQRQFVFVTRPAHSCSLARLAHDSTILYPSEDNFEEGFRSLGPGLQKKRTSGQHH